jgi:hypothetical protein
MRGPDLAWTNRPEVQMSISRSSSFRTVVAIAAAGVVGCAHEAVQKSDAPLSNSWRAGQSHFAAGCLLACQDATYVELSPKKDLCRCWAPNAFQYTFAFPDTPDKLAYSRSRWSTGVQTVRRCQAEGRAWEPSENREEIICMDPSAPPAANAEPSVAGHSAPAERLPETVF